PTTSGVAVARMTGVADPFMKRVAISGSTTAMVAPTPRIKAMPMPNNRALALTPLPGAGSLGRVAPVSDFKPPGWLGSVVAPGEEARPATMAVMDENTLAATISVPV